jgi:crotonobetainyl-CoA:carnitine CoA-transferase CaiB-like acyl-CoA transferase
MLLGDLGAEVIKVEPPAGDEARQYGPPFVGGESPYFLAVNRNKKSVVLDLGLLEDRERALQLALSADVLVENLRPGQMDSLGLGYAALSAQRPDLVYCSITAYGREGPYRDRAGYDLLVSAMGGLLGITGEPDGAPVKPGIPILDILAGSLAYGSILAALLQVRAGGGGQRLDVSLMSVQLAALLYPATAYLNAGFVMGPSGSAHPALLPYQAFRAADGYVVITAGNDGLFGRLSEALGHAEWKTDPRFATNPERVGHRRELESEIERELAREPVAHWLAVLDAAGVPVAPVNRIDQVFADEQVRFMQAVQEVSHPSLGSVKLVEPPVRFSRTPAKIQDPPPLLGQHNELLVSRSEIRKNDHHRLDTSS